VGAARSRNPAAAKADVAKIDALRATLLASRDEYWAQQLEIQQLAANAWIALAEERTDEALTLMKKAAEIEDSTDKSAVSPGPLAPAREMLGEMLLEMGEPAESQRQLEVVMKKEPNRFRTFYLGARAAAAANDAGAAKTYYARIVEMCPKGDARPELTDAKKKAGA
jgi:predicted Zn-dependent protease